MTEELEFTGERVIPGKVDEALWYEHMARYIFAADFVKEKRVLDAGCGSGYGADFLASQGAKFVLGVDNSQEAIDYAKAHYRRENLEFGVMDVTALSLPDKSFDVVVSFEVIEHLRDQERFLAEMRRILKEDGVFCLSTPNREVYRLGQEPNPFHTREFNFEELYQILSRYFRNIKILAQDYLAGIVIAPVFGDHPKVKKIVIDHSLIKKKPPCLYFIALCSQAELKDLIHAHKLVHFSYDREEYLGKLQAEFEDKLTWALKLNQEVREHKERIATLQAELAQRENQIAEIRGELSDWRKQAQELREELGRREEQVATLQAELREKNEHIARLHNEWERNQELLQRLEQQVGSLQQQLSSLQNALLWPKVRRNLRKVLWPLIGFYRLIRPFWKLRTPPEWHFKRALIITSASKAIVFKVIDNLLQRFPYIQFTVLVPDGLQDELRTHWPQLEIEVFNRLEYRRNPLGLLVNLWWRDFDLCVVMLTGERGFYKRKFAGFLSGARYLMVYNENIDSFYWMLGCINKIAKHVSWRMRLGQLHLNLKYWLSYPLASIGFLVVLVRALPLLIRAVFRRKLV